MSAVAENCLVKNKDFSIHRYLPQNNENNLVVVCFDEIHGGLKKKGFGTDFLIKNNIENFLFHTLSSHFIKVLAKKIFIII